MNSRIRFYSLLVILALACSIVFADGDSRTATPAEKEFGKSVLNAFAKALPPGPEGWEKTGDSTVITDLKTIYTDVNKPLRIDYCVAWQDSKRMGEAQAQFNEEMMKLVQKPGINANQAVELQKKVEELQKKMELQDVKARIDLYTNVSSQGLYDKPNPGTAIAGGLVYRTDGKNSGGWREGSTFVFLGGNWKLAGQYANFTPAKPATSSMVIQNIVVKIQADPKRADQFVQKIDWQALKGLIK